MSTQVIQTPGGIDFSGFYYPELKQAMLTFFRTNKDKLGLTDENDFEVHVQMVSAFAFMGHLNNTRLDTVATEMFIDSAQLLESVKKLMRLVGVELRSASPAVADIVAKLSEVTTLDQSGFIPALAEFTTDSIPPITYEASEDGEDLSRTDQVEHVFGLEAQAAAGSGTAGFLDTNSPDIFNDLAVVFPADVVGDVLSIPAVDLKSNHGFFRVTERISDTAIRLVTEPGGESPAFTTETGLAWTRLRYTSDQASQANDDTPTELVQPWVTAPGGSDMMFISHLQVQPTRVDLTFDTLGVDGLGLWEYYDSERSAFNPKTVSGTTTLIFDCEPLLGTVSRAGAQVKVTYLKTGSSKVLTSTWTGAANIITTTNLLGQTSASTDQEDYNITSDWVPFSNQVDSTVVGGDDWEQDGNISFDLPQTRDRKWNKTNMNNQIAEAIWFRYRVIIPHSNAPKIKRIKIDQGDQHISYLVTQGESVGPQIIGSSTGLTSQFFNLPETPFLDASETIEVDEGGVGVFLEYARVDTFLNSSSTDRHYIRETNAQDVATVRFGDGITGKIPPSGLGNIRATYRVGGAEDGNVGEQTITVNAEGVSGISELFNPRLAEGWRIKDGGNDIDLERVKRDGPAEQRVRNTAAKPQDAERLAVQSFTDTTGIKPVVRAFAVEEGFGIKTMKLLVVGEGGSALTTSQLTALELYFNGDRHARPPVEGVSIMNYQVIPKNFEPTVISIETTVIWDGGSVSAIKNALLAFLIPDAVEDDGVTYVWNFGAQVSYSRVYSLIHSVDPNIRDVSVLRLKKGAGSFVTQSLDLGANELPITNSVSITVTVQSTTP